MLKLFQDEPFPDCTDGTWNGKRYFTSDYGKGLFCPLSSLKLDTRYEHSQFKFENRMQLSLLSNIIIHVII